VREPDVANIVVSKKFSARMRGVVGGIRTALPAAR
jgi:hypothetical protein